MRPAFRYVSGLLKRGFIGMIRFYQRRISPLKPPSCKYTPTCSAYALKAIEVHGPGKGLLLAAWRLLRCNPMSNGGVDYVPLPGTWKNPWHGINTVKESDYHQPKGKK